MLCVQGNERRFKTAGARLPNSRKLPKDFFSSSKVPDQSHLSTLSLEKHRREKAIKQSFDFTFMVQKRESCSIQCNPHNEMRETKLVLPQLRKSHSGDLEQPSGHKLMLDFRLPNQKSILNKALSKVSLINLHIRQ